MVIMELMYLVKIMMKQATNEERRRGLMLHETLLSKTK